MLLYRITDALADLTTHVSKTAAEYYTRRACPYGRIRHLPNGVDMKALSASRTRRDTIRRNLGIGDAFVWIAVGRLDEPKDYPNMLDAFAQVRSANRKRFVLLVVGSGELKLDIERRVTDACLGDTVRLLGSRDDVPDLLAAADAYVMSSAWEGLPLALIEACGSGLPAVTTEVGGTCEIVIDGLTGHLVPPRDPQALAASILRIMDMDSTARIEMGARAREHALRLYDMESVANAWEDVYSKALRV